ncbi:MAG: HD domain-containing protein [Deltaproteobacteria bacterium]|nr:HD domain-containing protein [Deltaproteobacteria bacterium]
MSKFEFALNLIEDCRGVEQGAERHPEGDVFIHSLQVMRHALRESEDVDLILAAILHDVGKKINTLGHEGIAEDLLRSCLFFSEKTLWLVKHHLRVRYMLDGIMQKRGKVRYLTDHKWFPELCLLSRWDKAGRRAGYIPKYDREKVIERLIKLDKEKV